MWGADLGFAWRLPALAPWKSLLRLDDEGEHGYDLYMKFRGPQMNPEDREIAEQLIRFLDLASVTLSCVPSIPARALLDAPQACRYG